MLSLLAIDPGAGGGIACIGAGMTAEAFAMPKTEADVIDLLRSIVVQYQVRTAYLEDTGKGIMPGRAKAMITLNVNAAVIRTALTFMGVRIIQLTPQVWQKHFQLGKRRDCASDTIWKNKLKAEAQRRFPGLNVTLDTADALLLLDYARAHE